MNIERRHKIQKYKILAGIESLEHAALLEKSAEGGDNGEGIGEGKLKVNSEGIVYI